MKNLQIDWLGLELAFERMGGDLSCMNEESKYLDTETGQVIVIDELVRDAIVAIVEQIDPSAIQDGQWKQGDIFRTPKYESLDEWMKPHLLSAIELEHGGNVSRFKPIPQFGSQDALKWMEAFAESVRDEATRKRLSAAIESGNPFRQFRDAIGCERQLHESWQAFESSRKREGITEWLRSVGIEPIHPEEVLHNPLPRTNLRETMFAEVRWFVESAHLIVGVERIALVGSLATNKEFPKDIDLLVTITNDCDLAGLARLGRQLAGHMAAHSSGADVFLASPLGEYLGRICPWKKCRPGVRVGCEALSCGARQFLHDDFDTIFLEQELIHYPPAILWPEATAKSGVPADVTEQLIGPLSNDSARVV